MTEDTRNLIIAVILSLSIVVGWQFVYVKPYQEELSLIEKTENPTKIEKFASAPTVSEGESVQNEITDNQSDIEVIEHISRADAINNSDKRVQIRTPQFTGSLNLKGARFDDLSMVQYRDHLGSDELVHMLAPHGTEHMYFVDFGWVGNSKSVKLPSQNDIWQTNNNILTPDSPITLTWDNGAGLKFSRKISVDKNLLFAIKDTVVNTSNADISLASYGFIDRARPDEMSFYISHEGLLGVFNETLEEISYDNLKDEDNEKWSVESEHGWSGIADKYWLTALIPSQDIKQKFNYKYRKLDGLNRYHADFISPLQTLRAGSEISVTNHLFVGAKRVDLLDSYGETLGLHLFDRAVDFGWLYFLTKPMYGALTYFEVFLGNFGLAILLMTVIIKVALFPLANKAFKSMAKMKKFAPHLQEIREQHKDDRNKQNQEMMKFYKENNINPLSGCLPMLVQIPIFFALYKVLFVTIEMRHAPFYGWIKDLSAKDPTDIFNLFGLIDWTPPGFLISIGVLPIAFMLTMVIQQKLNPPPSDPTQAMIIKWMPYIFVFLFASFPAGLVIYWVWSNMLSILQQYIITRRIVDEE